jgi:metal-responsive CopG/Arc/MetJ family transcriptional regulator
MATSPVPENHTKFTLNLPDDLLADLNHEARRLGMTKSEIVRRAVSVHLERVKSRSPALPERKG